MDDRRDAYALEALIGQGAFGQVYRARSHASGHLVAIKVIEYDNDAEMSQLSQEVEAEVDMLRRCACPHVIKYLDCVKFSRGLWLVTELCDAGSLADTMRASGAPLEEGPLAAVLGAAVSALGYLHSLLLLHRDVKAANLLLTGDGMVKLADFGISAQLTQTMDRRSTAIGTPLWMAPEVIQEGVRREVSNTGPPWISLCGRRSLGMPLIYTPVRVSRLCSGVFRQR